MSFNFQNLGFIDVSACAAWYVVKFRDRMEKDAIGLRCDGQDEAVLGEWRSAKTLLAKMESAGAAITGGKPVRVTSAIVTRLKTGDINNWHKVESEGLRVYLPLIPSPGAMLFSGLESANPPVGMMTLVSRAHPFSAINLGPCAAVWLMADVDVPDRET